MIDQNMVNYSTTLFPAPNVTAFIEFNGLDTTKNITRQDEGDVRLDHQFSQHDYVWARYTSFRQPVSGSGGFIGLSARAGNQRVQRRRQLHPPVLGQHAGRVPFRTHIA